MSKNIQKVQEMLDGDYKNKIQTGYESKTETHRVGDKWEDSDGVRWEQKDGYRSKLRNVPDMGLFSKQCKDCKKNCSLDKRDKNTFVRMDRCFHCQLNFEIELKSKPIGANGNKWNFWVRLQMLHRWSSIDREIDQYMETYWEEGKNLFDKSVVNAIANQNLEGVKYEDIK